jgi:hypothetical protein
MPFHKKNCKCLICGKTCERTSSRQLYCKDCIPDSKTRNRYWRYGMDANKIKDLVDKQKGVCAICQKERIEVIDHNHKTGEVRGLLCQKCNQRLGILENEEFINKAITYLNAF